MIKRTATESVRRIADTFRVLLLTGPRQVGKTTLLQGLLPSGMQYITLDDEVLRARAQEDPNGFLDEYHWPLMIDEVQYAPQLFPYIKMRVDAEGQKSMYWLTGSQQFTLMKNVQESLAGRVGIIELNSLSYAELHPRRIDTTGVFDPQQIDRRKSIATDVNSLYQHIFQGGMPELYSENPPTKSDFFRSYIDTYISRDVEEILNIQDANSFKLFMRALASYNGERLNYSSLANAVHISDKTAQRWIDVLVTSGVIYLLEPFYHNELGRISHMPKVIFMDQGLASYLEGWESARDLQLSSRSGRYLEAFVISELIKSYNAHGIEPRLNFFRDSKNAEIDLLISRNSQVFPFEIKKTATPKKEMLKHFASLRDYVDNVGAGGLICLYDSLTHLNQEDWVIPIGLVL